MRLCFACVLAAAACSSGNGAYVTVELNGTGATTVALYIGQAPCTTSAGSACTAIDPIAAAQTGSGSGSAMRIDPLPIGSGAAAGAWFQSDNVADGLVQGVPSGARRVVFHVEAGGDAQPVQLIAIGSDGNGPVSSALVYDLEIPAGSSKPVDVTMTLEASQPAALHEGDDNHADGTFVDVWDANPMLDPIACVLVEQWANNTPTRTFIVPPQDADCDGVPTYSPGTMTKNPAECRELWFDYREPADSLDLGDTTCATPTSMTGGAGACVLGGYPCVDGMGRISSTCAAEAAQVCIPANNCLGANPLCEAPQPTTSFDTCSKSSTAPYGVVVVCTFATDATGAPCPPTTVVGPNESPVHGHSGLGQLFPPTSTATCNDLWVAPVDSILSLQPGNPEIDIGQAEFDLTLNNLNGPCDFDIDWNNGDPVHTFTPATQVIALELSNGNTLLLPLEILQGQCATNTAPADHALACEVQFDAAGIDPITNCAM